MSASEEPSPLPHIHLLCIYDEYVTEYNKAAAQHGLDIPLTIHESSLQFVPPSYQFDVIVSPANSYGIMDGGMDDAISRAFSPSNDYLALTRVVQRKLYDEYRGFAPPGTCTLIDIPDSFIDISRNVWGTRTVALCPTMRTPQDVRWDKEVVYESIWTLLCAIDKHNRTVREGGNGREIRSLMMTPLATGAGGVSARKWANQMVLAVKHFVEASRNPERWSRFDWNEALDVSHEVKYSWYL